MTPTADQTAAGTFPVALEDLKALFDVAVNSMDFGSGFLDTDEVDVLRRIAAAIGVDPLVGTPVNFAKYHPHCYQKPLKIAGMYRYACCDAPADAACHVTAEEAS